MTNGTAPWGDLECTVGRIPDARHRPLVAAAVEERS